MKKRLLSLLLAVVMVVTLLPFGAFAEETINYKEVYVNPLYSDVITKEDIASSVKKPAHLFASKEPEYLTSMDDAASILREGMEARKAQITVYVATDDRNPLEKLMEAAMQETGVPTQGDYIRWTYAGWEGEVNGYQENGLYYLTIAYSCTYYTTAAQENQLAERVNEVLDGFDFTAETSDYETISTIYDYICANVTYDYDNLNDDDYLLKYTAYAALMNGTSVCQGYAALLYRMLLQENIGCRLIPGDNHAWNIVEIDNLYYNVDSTWDAGRVPGYYSYFLLSDNDFAGHTRYADYCTSEFYRTYPMAPVSYNVHPTHDWNQGEITTDPTCTAGGVKTYSCTCCNANKTEEIPALGHNYVDGVCSNCGDVKIAAPEITVSNNTTSGKPVIKWGAVNGAEKYEVWRSTSKTGTYKNLSTTTKTSITNTSTEAGTKYYYKVRAVADDGTLSDFSAIKSITCDCAKPVVKATNVASSGKIKLSWSKITGAEKYEVYRATSKSGTYSKVGSATGTSYTDKKAKAGKKYYYKVKAICANTNGNSAYSAIVSLTCDCARPAVSIKLSSGHPKLSWDKVTGAQKYYVYRATSKSGDYTKIGSTTSTSYTDKTAKAGKTYYYKVKAINAKSAANSAYSLVDLIKAK